MAGQSPAFALIAAIVEIFPGRAECHNHGLRKVGLDMGLEGHISSIDDAESVHRSAGQDVPAGLQESGVNFLADRCCPTAAVIDQDDAVEQDLPIVVEVNSHPQAGGCGLEVVEMEDAAKPDPVRRPSRVDRRVPDCVSRLPGGKDPVTLGLIEVDVVVPPRRRLPVGHEPT